METEKREHRRFEIPDAYIRYKKQGVWGMVAPWSDKNDLINISRGGLCFVGPDTLRVGDRIVSNLFLPGGVCWSLKGEVVWKGRDENAEPAVGVRFDAVKNDYEFDVKGINLAAVKKLAALHDAAHIVMATFLGFPTDYAVLFPNGNGEYKIDFGEKAFMAVPLMVSEISPELFSFYDDKPRILCQDIAKRVCYILMAGGIAESIARHADCSSFTAQVRLNGPDMTRAAAIAEHFFIDLMTEMQFLYESLRDERFWTPIDHLANALLAGENNRLPRDQIHQILVEADLWKFLFN
jgi:hypothetical protein